MKLRYVTKSFESRSLSNVAMDLQSFLNRAGEIKVVSISHSSYSVQGGYFYSALLVYEIQD